jgi:hypothetical protein
MKRPDGLPHPQTVTDTFLSAILDELRTLRGESPLVQDRSELPKLERVTEPAVERTEPVTHAATHPIQVAGYPAEEIEEEPAPVVQVPKSSRKGGRR